MLALAGGHHHTMLKFLQLQLSESLLSSCRLHRFRNPDGEEVWETSKHGSVQKRPDMHNICVRKIWLSPPNGPNEGNGSNQVDNPHQH